MAQINKGRFTVDLGDREEIVVFLIGMRINKPWKVRQWFPVFTAMPRMLKYLDQHPEKGLLHWEQYLPLLTVQYWNSFEDLAAFARDKDDPHLEAWRKFNRRVAGSGDVGIWHETYVVKTKDIESISGNMPARGLAAATGAVPVPRGRDSAVARAGRGADDPALPPY